MLFRCYKSKWLKLSEIKRKKLTGTTPRDTERRVCRRGGRKAGRKKRKKNEMGGWVKEK